MLRRRTKYPSHLAARIRGRILCSVAAVLVSAAAGACAGAAHAAAAHAGAAPIKVSVRGSGVGPSVAAGFVGLATEYWNVETEVGTDPARPDVPFEQVTRNLAPYGTLSFRIGGDSTDWTWWPIPGVKQPIWVRWTMTPAWAAVTKRLVDDLHASLIVGLNMEANSQKVDDAELHAIQTNVGGSAPITFELGNEPELYAHFPFYRTKAGKFVLGRPKGYSYSEITSQWTQMAKALPNVRLAGPGYSSLKALPYVSQFLSATHRVSLLTVHTYPLKAKRCDGGANLQESQLFEPSSLQQMAAALTSWTTVAHHYGVGVRVDEMNSVTCGGSLGFSKTFGPALWALNILPLYAEAGATGVNFQTRPYTAQNLIQTDHTGSGWRVLVQPEYYGLLAFAKLTPPGSRILRVPAKLPQGLFAWAVRTPQGQTHVVVTNVTGAAATVRLKASGATGPGTMESLKSAGGLGSSTGVTLGGQAISPLTGKLTGPLVTQKVRPSSGAYDVTVPAGSAQIVTFPS